ncbi:MAG: hypothetical protein E6Q89_07445 [Bacteroidia bacterium]|nr:MAG: hypothetical protein E6Q89_07445 [Bacteroidia bacterium]
MFYIIKKKLFSDEEEPSVVLSNQELVNQVLISFKETIERESFNRRMMYDCSYLILMRPDDYKRSELRLATITDGIIDEFYEYIKTKKDQYPKCEPIGNFWDFQYCPAEKGVDGTAIEPGQVQVISAPTTEKPWTEMSSEQIKVSISSKHSKYSKYDLNANSFSNIDILSKGHYRVKIDRDILLPNVASQATAPQAPQTGSFEKPVSDRLATIQFVVNRQRYTFLMKEKQLKISKAMEGVNTTPTLLCIQEPSGSLQKEHIMIKYDDVARAFSIAIFAPAFVNEQNITVSRVGELPIWHPLKSESSIVCGIFQIDFKSAIN